LSGFGRDDEHLFRELFKSAAIPGWQLGAEADASALLIDFDSMYGQMAWLQSQGSGRPIVALTVALRADTDFLLQRPATAASLREMLGQVAAVLDGSAERRPPGSPAIAAAAPAAPSETIEAPASTASVATAAPAAPARTEVAKPVSSTAVTAEHPAADVPVATPRARRLVDFLQPGALPGPVRLRGAEPALLVDTIAGNYAGGTALKPLMEHARRDIAAGDWEPVTPAEYTRMQAELGGVQPLSRLRWLAALVGFDGALDPALAGATRFKLNKWPQSEREFPKHFRIATALLKQPGSLDDLATASGANAAEVADFINACHTLGIIDAEGAAGGGGSTDPGKGGLMSRLRGR